MCRRERGYAYVAQWQPQMANHQLCCVKKSEKQSKTKAHENAKAAQLALLLHLFCSLPLLRL